MEVKRLFVTGMFRSGTTLLARAFNAHPSISFASDPFFEFFKHARNTYYTGKEEDFDSNQPLSDKFWEDKKRQKFF